MVDIPSKKTRCFNPGDARGASVVLGGGLSGLSAGYALTRAGLKAVVFEADREVGGLSKTIRTGEFRYDIGGHRFFTKNRGIYDLVAGLMDGELSRVHRKSKIFMRGRFFDYPLRPANAVFGLGLSTVLRILADYGWLKIRRHAVGGPVISLEDWVVNNFGRTMFNIYFKEYSEKVWGLDCGRISEKWVAQRIQGLSLWKAIKKAFFRFTGKEIPTLADAFLYPELGIGRLAERFREEIDIRNRLFTDTAVTGIHHNGREITGVEITNCQNTCMVEAEDYISTIPLNTLVRMMEPQPPEEVRRAASSLGFRDLLLVSVKVDRDSVTDQNWIYIPEKKYLFGRLHEPKVWSRKMAPEGKTLVVVEYFCFRGDEIWNTPDERLSEITVSGLEELGFIQADEVSGTEVLRVPRAYPLFEVGYEEHCSTIYEYLGQFSNLSVAGRSGMFQYQNMDHAMESGLEAAEKIIQRSSTA